MATREELEEVISDICPNYTIRKDRCGKLIIHTNMSEDEFGELVGDDDILFDEEDEDDLDQLDDDMIPLEDDEDEA